MPHFRWYGVTIDGSYKQGIQSALSKEHLEKNLLEQHQIAITNCHETNSWFSKQPSIEQKTAFFDALHMFLSIGIRSSEALETIGHTLHDSIVLQQFAYNASYKIKEGESLYQIMKESRLFSPFEINSIMIGEKTGKLGLSIVTIVHYLNFRHSFTKNTKNALIMPTIIFTITILLTIGIILYIIPQFAHFILQTGKQLPKNFELLMQLRLLLISPPFLALLSICILLFGMLHRYVSKTNTYQIIKATILEYIPWYQTFKTIEFNMQFFYTLHSAISQGHPLPDALLLLQTTTSKKYQSIITHLHQRLQDGEKLQHAIQSFPLFSANDIALITAGENTGSLERVTKIVYEKHTQSMQAFFKRIQVYSQPLCIILLGFIIGSMLITIYQPIFSLVISI